MSYRGSKFPEGVDPSVYEELDSVGDIKCRHFCRTTLQAMNSNDSIRTACLGCGDPGAVIVVTDIDTDRIFIRKGGHCLRTSHAQPTSD